jgi:predicted dehydrogenase
MAAAATSASRLLMEALMYRFNKRTSSFIRSIHGRVVHVHAAFAARQDNSANIRLKADLGGGALMDLGCYVVDAARWILGEPNQIYAVADVQGVDRNVAALLSFPQGGKATLWASFDAPEHQELSISTEGTTVRLGPVGGQLLGHRPFAAWADPAEKDRLAPYVSMVAAFSESVLNGLPAPLPVADSIANLTVMDEIRRVAGITFTAPISGGTGAPPE